MPADPLSTAWAKYHWASKHLEAVDAAMGRSLDPKLHSVAFDAEVKGDRRRAIALIRIKRLPIIRTDVGLSLGDTVHNFRSALDHLAWALVKAGTDPRPKKPTGVYFPIANSFGEFKRRVNGWLPGVPDDQRAAIREYQPYRRGDRAKAIRWLNKLSNTDKHRVLIPTVINHSRIECTLNSNWQITKWEWLVQRPRALYVGTPVIRATLVPAARSDCEVKVEGGAAIHPSLGYGVPTGTALGMIRGTVFEILARFEAML